MDLNEKKEDGPRHVSEETRWVTHNAKLMEQLQEMTINFEDTKPWTKSCLREVDGSRPQMIADGSLSALKFVSGPIPRVP